MVRLGSSLYISGTRRLMPDISVHSMVIKSVVVSLHLILFETVAYIYAIICIFLDVKPIVI